MVPGKNPMMVGRSSIDCKIKQIESAPTKDVRSRTLKTFSKFFSVSEHLDLRKFPCHIAHTHQQALSYFIANLLTTLKYSTFENHIKPLLPYATPFVRLLLSKTN